MKRLAAAHVPFNDAKFILIVHQYQFPAYLSDNASSISPADKSRYDAQQRCATKILAIFDDPAYSDNNTKMASEVVALMNEVSTSLTHCLRGTLSQWPDAISWLTTI